MEEENQQLKRLMKNNKIQSNRVNHSRNVYHDYHSNTEVPAYLSHNEPIPTYHNVSQQLRLAREVREPESLQQLKNPNYYGDYLPKRETIEP